MSDDRRDALDKMRQELDAVLRDTCVDREPLRDAIRRLEGLIVDLVQQQNATIHELQADLERLRAERDQLRQQLKERKN